MPAPHVVAHPLLERALAQMRSAQTSRAAFRTAMAEAAGMLAYEALRDLPVREEQVRTPLEATPVRVPDGAVAVVAVLRAGLGMVDGFLRLVPDAAVGHIGLRRDEESLAARGYFESLPDGLAEATVFLVDPMLATGGSAVAALARLRAAGAQDLRLVCLVAAPEGLAAVRAAEPGVPVTVAAVDRELDSRGYIRPGLGDAGDRLFGTS